MVTGQWMVEDVIESRMEQEELYWKEQMAEQLDIINGSSSENDEPDH